MQELELTNGLLDEIKYIEQLQECVKESEAESSTGQSGGFFTLICC